MVLRSLLASGHQPPAGGVERAIDFIRRHTDSEGALGRADALLPDYPTYATALAIFALHARKDCGDLVRRMSDYLRTQQFAEDNGWSPDHPAYGAWGMGGDPKRPPHPGHVDLSMTRHAIQALHTSVGGKQDPALKKARVFLARCQNRGNGGDGGFFFSPVVVDANKAGHDGKRYRSYASATADGILALLGTGSPHHSEELQAARRWLQNRLPCFTGEAHARWSQGLFFYYAAAGAEAFATLGIPGPASWIPSLAARQRSDGNWRNPEPLVKEDDPLIATALALRAFTWSCQ